MTQTSGKPLEGGPIQDRLRGHYVTGLNGRRDFSPYIPPISLEAANRIDELEAVLRVIANGGAGQYQWSFTKAEKLAREVLHND